MSLLALLEAVDVGAHVAGWLTPESAARLGRVSRGVHAALHAAYDANPMLPAMMTASATHHGGGDGGMLTKTRVMELFCLSPDEAYVLPHQVKGRWGGGHYCLYDPCDLGAVVSIYKRSGKGYGERLRVRGKRKPRKPRAKAPPLVRYKRSDPRHRHWLPTGPANAPETLRAWEIHFEESNIRMMQGRRY